MTTTKKRLLTGLLVLTLGLTGCGGDTPPQADGAKEEKAAGGKKNGKQGPGKGKGQGKGGGKPGGLPSAVPTTAEGSPIPGTGTNEDAGTTTDDPTEDGPDADAELATASAYIGEPEPDGKKSGLAPSYPEVLSVSIVGLGKDVRFTMNFAGDIPSAMPDKNTYMVIGIGLSGRKENETYALGAQATHEGWKAYAGGKGGATDFPGTFNISGAQITMTIPWSYIDGPHRFDWYANSSWFQSVGQVSSYIFDPVPNEGPGKFPN